MEQKLIIGDKEYNDLYKTSEVFRELEKNSELIFSVLTKVCLYNDFSNNLQDLKSLSKTIKRIQKIKSRKKLNSIEIYNVLYVPNMEYFDLDEIENNFWYFLQDVPKSNMNENELKRRIDNIYPQLCREIERKCFRSFLDYADLQDRVS